MRELFTRSHSKLLNLQVEGTPQLRAVPSRDLILIFLSFQAKKNWQRTGDVVMPSMLRVDSKGSTGGTTHIYLRSNNLSFGFSSEVEPKSTQTRTRLLLQSSIILLPQILTVALHTAKRSQKTTFWKLLRFSSICLCSWSLLELSPASSWVSISLLF